MGLFLGPHILSSELLNFFLFVFTKNVLKGRKKERKKKKEGRKFSIKTSFRIIKPNCKQFFVPC